MLIMMVVPSLAVNNAFADGVAVMEVPGNTVIPIQQDEVRMVKEVVRVNEEDEVTATFTFENRTPKDISFRMGFPFTEGTDPIAVPYGVPGSGKFEVRINGKQVEYHKKPVSINAKLKIGAEYVSMYAWQISFKPHEKKTVECIYTASWNCDVGPYPSCRHFTYITKTGALWNGTIGQADFYVTLSNDYIKNARAGKLDFKIEPADYKIAGNTVEWHFRDWKPTEDISIWVSRSKSYPLQDFELLRSIMEILDFKTTYEGNVRLYTLKDLQDYRAQVDDSLNKLYVKVLRNEIFARHGKPFKDGTLQAIFNNYAWYKPNPNYSDKMLNEYEKKNVEIILNYERQKGWIK